MHTQTQTRRHRQTHTHGNQYTKRTIKHRQQKQHRTTPRHPGVAHRHRHRQTEDTSPTPTPTHHAPCQKQVLKLLAVLALVQILTQLRQQHTTPLLTHAHSCLRHWRVCTCARLRVCACKHTRLAHPRSLLPAPLVRVVRVCGVCVCTCAHAYSPLTCSDFHEGIKANLIGPFAN